MHTQQIHDSLIPFFEVLSTEAQAILRVSRQLQAEPVKEALTLLASCQGKVIVMGVGKSGIIAQKIAGTIRSIGIVSVSLHPCDAMHGDLGVMTADDVAFVLSNSGETEELLNILPHLRRRNIPLIAIVGNLQSSLARQADVVIDATIDREVCPLNLAPTTSTTVALALGDAFAMTLMHIKQVTPELFAFNHPSGRLGKRLTITVRDLMHGGSTHPTLSPHASWLDVVSMISQGGLGAVNIVSSDGQLLGLITDGDLRRCMQKTKTADLESLQADLIMTVDPVVASPDDLAYDALKLMENRPSQISVLPVVDTQRHCIGLLRLHDIVRCGL